jgi:autotransporter-like protein
MRRRRPVSTTRFRSATRRCGRWAPRPAFTGLSTAQLAIGPLPVTQVSTIQGFVTTAGQITMVFTPTTGGTPTVGLGQMRLIDGVMQMEMQMITGGSLLITHWAYMNPYNPASFTPPPPLPIPANSEPQWAWMSGTPWRIASPAMFGTGTAGRFVVTDYQNGYFWGTGIGPAGSHAGNFTLLGSVTPEGRVLFNTLSRGNLTSQYGAATGDASGAQMVVSTYDLMGNPAGGPTYISLVQPYAGVLAAENNRAGLGAADALYRLAATPASVTGPMAPAFVALDNLSASGLSTAISQTLPVLAGAASQATYATQRVLNQTVGGRLDDVYGVGADVAAADRNFWLKPLGAIARQNGLDGAPGYRASGGGVAAGIDGSISSRAALGGVFAYSHQAVTGSDDAVPNRLGIDSYQLGLYGAYVLRPDTQVDFQLDGGINRNSENRGITFINSAASANYRSSTGHAGVAVKKLIPDPGRANGAALAAPRLRAGPRRCLQRKRRGRLEPECQRANLSRADGDGRREGRPGNRQAASSHRRRRRRLQYPERRIADHRGLCRWRRQLRHQRAQAVALALFPGCRSRREQERQSRSQRALWPAGQSDRLS